MSRTESNPRTATTLNGEWSFKTDPDDVGTERDYHEPDGWPDDGTHTVTVPHAWQEIEAHADYVGTAWYRTTVDYDGDGSRVFLSFAAVDYETTVYVNGVEVGTHSDGYLPFEFEVTDAIRRGENVVVVRVHDPLDISEIPHGKQGDPWYTRVSGIWQSVTLETRPETFVTRVRATPDLTDDTVTLGVEAVEDARGTASVTVSRNGDTVAETECEVREGSGECVVEFDDPDYWTPEDPALYDVTVSLGTDRYEDYFGMRSVSHDGDRLYLNGDPLYVRGALDQAFYPETLYRPFDADIFEAEIRLAKEMGFNMLRKHIKPAHPDFVEAADRLGILVWEEPANPDRYTDRSKREVQNQLRGLIERDYNSPSVVAWSIYNEEWGIGLDQEDYSDHSGRLWNDAEKQSYLTDLYHDVKAWDPTRLVCDNSGWAHVATDLNDYHEYYVSPDRSAAWSEGLDHILAEPGDNYAVENTPAEDAPILVSEFGTWGFPDLDELRDQYGGDPPWFSHEFLDEPLKRPEGVDDRYEATDLPDVFDDYGDLASVWQRREWDSIKDVIQQMRMRDGVAGYCITEFSDIEWEFNGMLDYFREPKNFVEDLPRVNDDLIVVADPSSRVAAPGETVSVDLRVVNDTNERLSGTVRWDAPGGAGSETATVNGFGTTTVVEGLEITVPEDTPTGPRELTISFETDDRTVDNSESLVVVGPEPPTDTAIYAEGAIADPLAAAGRTVVPDLADAEVAVVQSVDDDVEAFVADGGAAVVVPGPDGRMAEDSVFEYRNLPAGESWNLVAALPYQNSDLVADISPDRRVGWAFEGLFPHDLAEGLDSEADEVHVGSVEGWLANWGSPLVVRDLGDGRVCSCTFRVTDAYGDHPTATFLVDRIVNAL